MSIGLLIVTGYYFFFEAKGFGALPALIAAHLALAAAASLAL